MDNLTFIIPVFSLCKNRESNLLKILNDIIPFNKEIILAEQYKDEPLLEHIASQYPEIRYLKFKIHSDQIQKSKLINTATRFCNTKFFFLHDCDFSVDYKNLFTCIKEKYMLYDFIQPYELSRDLNLKDTYNYKTGKINISDISYFPENFQEQNIRHVNVFGALGFICNLDKFISINGMDESYQGWGYEDFDLFMRIHEPLPGSCNILIPRGIYGVHMWHPPSNMKMHDSNKKLFESKGYSRGKINTILKTHYYQDWEYDTLEPV